MFSRLARTAVQFAAQQLSPRSEKPLVHFKLYSNGNAGKPLGNGPEDTTSQPLLEPAQRSQVDLIKGPLGVLPSISFHGCRYSPETVFSRGLLAEHQFPLDPADPVQWRKALYDHAWGVPEHSWRLGLQWMGCRFVGTSKNPEVAKDFTGVNYGNETPHVYEVDLAYLQEKGYPIDDVNKALSDSPYEREHEVAIHNMIPSEAIVRAWPVVESRGTLGEPIANPNYRKNPSAGEQAPLPPSEPGLPFV